MSTRGSGVEEGHSSIRGGFNVSYLSVQPLGRGQAAQVTDALCTGRRYASCHLCDFGHFEGCIHAAVKDACLLIHPAPPLVPRQVQER